MCLRRLNSDSRWTRLCGSLRRTRIVLCVPLLVVSSLTFTSCARPPASSPVEVSGTTYLHASRQFAAKVDLTGLGAYGIVAFRSGATDASRQRYRAICSAYIATIPSFREVAEHVDLQHQMVTVWPVKTAYLADKLNFDTQARPRERCADAVEDVDLYTSLDAIRRAEAQTGRSLSGDGPFLLAWSPTESFHHENALVLSMNLSRVANVEQATKVFSYWIDRIQTNPDLWSGGWSLDGLRMAIRNAADWLGPHLLLLLEHSDGRT